MGMGMGMPELLVASLGSLVLFVLMLFARWLRLILGPLLLIGGLLLLLSGVFAWQEVRDTVSSAGPAGIIVQQLQPVQSREERSQLQMTAGVILAGAGIGVLAWAIYPPKRNMQAN